MWGIMARSISKPERRFLDFGVSREIDFISCAPIFHKGFQGAISAVTKDVTMPLRIVIDTRGKSNPPDYAVFR